MGLECKHKPHFSRREWGFLFGLILAAVSYLGPIDEAAPSIIKMPKPLPDVVKSHKSKTIYAGRLGMSNSGVQVRPGDRITILARGQIDISPHMSDRIFGPERLLTYKLSENDSPQRYRGPEVIEIRETGSIYLSYGERFNSPSHIHKGYFEVDIIAWNTDDPKRMAKFLEERSLAQPKDQDLKKMAQEFKKLQEITLVLRGKATEIEEIKKELSVAEKRETSAPPPAGPPVKAEVQEAKKPQKEMTDQKAANKGEKPVPSEDKMLAEAKPTGPEKAPSAAAQTPQEEKKTVEELTEKLQHAMQAMKELEEMKKKLSEREEREAQILARLESMEVEKSRQSKNLPVISIGYPKDGISVDSEYVSIYGVAEHEAGISKFEILLNGKPIGSKDQRALQLAPKDRKRIEFSERVRLQEGQNAISIIAQGREGVTNQKNLSIQLAKKQEKLYAVVVGINKYKNLPSLKYAVNDARAFYDYLVVKNQVPKDRVWLLLDEEATLDRLRSTLGTRLRRSAGKDDTVIIFLAGHGATEQDASSPDGDGLEKYILPHNADPKDLYSSAMPMSEVARIFQRISSERLVFIGDTCYSGASGGRTILAGGARATVSGMFLERLSQGRGRVILTAGDANELSVEKDDLKHGVFTYYLLEGLRGKADLDGDGVITVDEVYRYVSMKVPNATGQSQHPVKKGETIGQIILGLVK